MTGRGLCKAPLRDTDEIEGKINRVLEEDGALMGARFAKALFADSDIPGFAIIGDLRNSSS